MFKNCNKILFIAAYNMTDKKMEIFNNLNKKYDDMKIVDAIIASMALPPYTYYYIYNDK